MRMPNLGRHFILLLTLAVLFGMGSARAITPLGGPFDFNADGKPDILWRNTASGATYAWYMNGPALISDAFIATHRPVMEGRRAWPTSTATASPTSSGETRANGDTYVWYMNGADLRLRRVPLLLPPEWVIQGVADFNADGKPDFLMRNASTGQRLRLVLQQQRADRRPVPLHHRPELEGGGGGRLQRGRPARPPLPQHGLGARLRLVHASTRPASSSLRQLLPADLLDRPGVGGGAAGGLERRRQARTSLFRNRDTGLVFVWYLNGTTLGGSDFIIQIDPSWEIVPRRADAVVVHPLAVSLTSNGNGSVSSTPPGINCGADCSENYVHGTVVSLSAVPGANSTFTGWSGACSGTGACDVTMDAAKSVTASFTLITYTLTVGVIDAQGLGLTHVTSTPGAIDCYELTGTCSAPFTAGSSVTLRLFPGANASFDKWTGACAGSGATCNLTINADTSTTGSSKCNGPCL